MAGGEPEGKRKRWETSGRLGWLFGVTPRVGRIETLKRGQAVCRVSSSGEGGRPGGKCMRGGLRPNGQSGRPRRGERPGEHRPRPAANAAGRGTDAQLEQGFGAGVLACSDLLQPGLVAEPSGALGSALHTRSRGYRDRSSRLSRWLASELTWLMSSDLPLESHEQSRGISRSVTSEVFEAAMDRGYRPSGWRLTQRQGSSGRREASRLAEWERLWRPKSHGRKWRETKPRGPGGIKPSRG